MKLTNRQKSIIWKSLNLNEDFFDDNQLDIPYDETTLDLEKINDKLTPLVDTFKKIRYYV